jgi:hypothetical protein
VLVRSGILDGINTLYLASVAGWGVLIGLLIVMVGLLLWLAGLRVLGSQLEPEIAIEWLPRWVALTRLERWTILWGYARMDRTERNIFKNLWMELDCRVYQELTLPQTVLLSSFGGAWLIGEIARSIKHPDWMTGLQRPSAMPVSERPTTFFQIVAADLAGKVIVGGFLISLFCLVTRAALR